MIVVYAILLVAGITPLVAFLAKRRRYRDILRRGVKTTARVTDRRKVRVHRQVRYDLITYAYQPEGSANWHTGQYKFGVGKVNVGDTLDLYYLADDPARHALAGSRGEGWFLLFCVLFFAMTAFGCYQIHKTLAGSTIRFSP